MLNLSLYYISLKLALKYTLILSLIILPMSHTVSLILTLNYLTPNLSFKHLLSWWLSPWSDFRLTLKLTWKLTLITNVLTMSHPFKTWLWIWFHIDHEPCILTSTLTLTISELEMTMNLTLNLKVISISILSQALILTLVLTIPIILTIFRPHF